MMSKNSNFSRVAFFSIICLVIFAPTITLAQVGQNNAGQRTGYFCQNVNNWTEKIENRFAEREKQLLSKQNERSGDLEQLRSSRMDDLKQNRLRWDNNRGDYYDKLANKTSNDEQKMALSEFKTSVEAAVAVRRQNIDQAVDNYRRGVDALITARKEKIGLATADYKTAILAAGTLARTECSNNAAPATVRQNYHAGLKKARDNFQTARREIDQTSDGISGLNQASREAVSQAVSDFKVALTEARNKLSQAWGLPPV